MKVLIPPIKCQGIKTKIVPDILQTLPQSFEGIWIEPFLGSGVVLFNVAPQRARVYDKNKHLINFYQGIQNGTITPQTVRDFLEYHGPKLQDQGKEYYLEMRSRFNQNGDPLYFLFLNRSDFNGMIRFNKKGEFNVPFCQKPNRFSKAYITKICNQVDAVAKVMQDKDWEFICGDWKEAFKTAHSSDWIYLDPPYIGRDTSYVGEWPDFEAELLSDYAHQTPATVCLSMWKENEFRENTHLIQFWNDFKWIPISHFYHFGGKESNRHPIIEVLAIKESNCPALKS